MTPWSFSKSIADDKAVRRHSTRVVQETLLNSDDWTMDGLSEEGMLLGMAALFIGACEAYGLVPRDALARVQAQVVKDAERDKAGS